MKIKTEELSGAALDWSVARALGAPKREISIRDGMVYAERGPVSGAIHAEMGPFSPSTDVVTGYAIIQREQIGVVPDAGLTASGPILNPDWLAENHKPYGNTAYQRGPTPLVAAMRCLVEAHLGDEVDVPMELTSQNKPRSSGPRM